MPADRLSLMSSTATRSPASSPCPRRCAKTDPRDRENQKLDIQGQKDGVDIINACATRPITGRPRPTVTRASAKRYDAAMLRPLSNRSDQR
jgi:hypothetical protein